MTHDSDVMESSALDLMGLSVVIEEGDYVFVGDPALDDGNGDPNDDWDDASYELCQLSSVLSCATSVATDLTLIDLNVIENPPAAAMNVDEPDDKDDAGAALPVMANPKNGLRLSKKKQRKLRRKMKMMRKAAATKAAAEAIARREGDATCAPPGSPRRASRGASSASPKRKAARTHAQESLAAYRDEIGAGKSQKKTRPVDCVM